VIALIAEHDRLIEVASNISLRDHAFCEAMAPALLADIQELPNPATAPAELGFLNRFSGPTARDEIVAYNELVIAHAAARGVVSLVPGTAAARLAWWDGEKARKAQLADACGYSDSAASKEGAWRAVSAAEHRIATTPARTMDGLLAKLRFMAAEIEQDHLDAQTIPGLLADAERLIAA